MRGNLIVRPKSAQLTRTTGLLGRMDPYVILSVGSQKKKTAASRNAGKNPVWNDQIEFSIQNEDTLRIQLYDKDLLRDDYIGDGAFSISRARQGGRNVESIPLTLNGKAVGQILMEIDFVQS